jgi:hypothetical protein
MLPFFRSLPALLGKSPTTKARAGLLRYREVRPRLCGLDGANLLTPALLMLSLLGLAGCGPEWSPPGPERIENRNVELDNSEELRAELKMGAGELRVRGGAAKLMEARFVYNRLRMRPEVTYHASAYRGHLVVEEPSGLHAGGSRYQWDLAFNDGKPIDLEVNCGAGQSHLDLGELSLKRLTVEMGVGELRLDLRGEPKNDYSVSIHGGIGQATVYLPSGVGIEANAEGGIGGIHTTGLEKHDGRYVNEAFGHAKTTVRVDVQGGIGEIRLVAE